MSDHTRRRFLGAAAAAATLPAVVGTGAAISDESDGDDQYGEHGTKATEIETGGPTFGAITMPDTWTEEADFSVTAYSYKDQESQVECNLKIGGANVTFTTPPDRAREMADELTLAADVAEDPSVDVGGGSQ